MNTAADIVDFLVAQSVAAIGAVDPDWAIYEDREEPDPERAVTIFNTGGLPQDPKFSRDHPTFQVRVHGAPGGQAEAHTKMDEITDLLLGPDKFSIGSNVWVGIWNTIPKLKLKDDERNRPVLVSSWRAVVEPPVSGNRQ